MSEADILAHLNAARDALLLEAYRGSGPQDMQVVDHFTIAEDLDRMDRTIGPKGESVFARIADCVRQAYVEIEAARQLIRPIGEPKR